MRIPILVIFLLLFVGCSNSVDLIIEEQVTKVSVMLDYKRKPAPQINDSELIREMVAKINTSPKIDVSNVQWERGPDGAMIFESADEKSYQFSFFSDQENVDVFWLDENMKLFSIDTNFALKDILSSSEQ